MEKYVVELSNIVKIFNKDLIVLKGINLKVSYGDVIGIIGPKNSGKGVLGKIIAGDVAPSLGKLYYGFDSVSPNNIGLQFRETSWPDGFRVKDMITLYKEIYNLEDEQWLQKLYSIFRVSDYWNNKLNKVDPLWLQLFNTFLAFLPKPKLIIIDAISTTIGVDIRKNIIDFILKYIEENDVAVIILAPDSTMFKRLCNRIILMDEGVIIKDEVIDSKARDKVYEEYLLESLKYIEENKSERILNPIYMPYIKKSLECIEIYKELYKKYIQLHFENRKLKTKKLLLSINKWKKILFWINIVLTDLGKKIETMKRHNQIKVEISYFEKEFKKFQRYYNKSVISFKLRNDINSFLEGSYVFINFILKDLKDFELEKTRVQKLDIINSKDKELERYKKKVILEEEKILKRFNRHTKANK
ncbi:ATP-binding cassette domain-containing protein [Spiroplasma endosymbiont of Aspidapion aeneum]|uniref:ATP-binding cassette domain-containing protein n=1 Tax=Spiroplasma endosymbiont of Aspidapion aeneum TaxID=3066276 RepID=UPI00313C4733